MIQISAKIILFSSIIKYNQHHQTSDFLIHNPTLWGLTKSSVTAIFQQPKKGLDDFPLAGGCSPPIVQDTHAASLRKDPVLVNIKTCPTLGMENYVTVCATLEKKRCKRKKRKWWRWRGAAAALTWPSLSSGPWYSIDSTLTYCHSLGTSQQLWRDVSKTKKKKSENAAGNKHTYPMQPR